MPPWADPVKIQAIYTLAQSITQSTGVLHVVDHVIPLCGKLVSGLHTEENLRVITDIANKIKGRTYDTGTV